jgi:hypothetical protein
MLKTIFDYRAMTTAELLNGTAQVEAPTADELARSAPLPV